MTYLLLETYGVVLLTRRKIKDQRWVKLLGDLDTDNFYTILGRLMLLHTLRRKNKAREEASV